MSLFVTCIFLVLCVIFTYCVFLFVDIFCYVFLFFVFFFFKQKTAYEMRISDWSSDVCSSDLHSEKLHAAARPGEPLAAAAFDAMERARVEALGARNMAGMRANLSASLALRMRSDPIARAQSHDDVPMRSEERRVGKGGVRTRRYRWSPAHKKKNNKKKD